MAIEIFSGFIDPDSQWSKKPETKEFTREFYKKRFEEKLDGMIDRHSKLSDFLIPNHSEAMIYIHRLFWQARMLYCEGHFFACSVMCGVVSERILKDLFFTNILLNAVSGPEKPSPDALKTLERIDVSSIRQFCLKSGLITDPVDKAADSIARNRNSFAHATGEGSEDEATKMIGNLQIVVEGTISGFANWDIVNGEYVWKKPGTPESEDSVMSLLRRGTRQNEVANTDNQNP